MYLRNDQFSFADLKIADKNKTRTENCTGFFIFNRLVITIQIP